MRSYPTTAPVSRETHRGQSLKRTKNVPYERILQRKRDPLEERIPLLAGVGQSSAPGPRTFIMRLRSSTLANSMLTRPLRAPSVIFTLVSKRSESDDAR